MVRQRDALTLFGCVIILLSGHLHRALVVTSAPSQVLLSLILSLILGQSQARKVERVSGQMQQNSADIYLP